MSHVRKSHGDSQRVRDHYRKKEADLRKRQNEELKRTRKSHQKNLNQLRYENGKAISDLRSRSSEQLRSEDIRHQSEINDLSRDHQRSLKGKDFEHERREEAQLRDFRNINQRQQDRYEAQSEAQRTKHGFTQRKQAEQNARGLEAYRQRHYDQTRSISRDLRNEYENRTAAQNDRHYKERSEILGDYEQYKLYKENELDRTSRDHRYQLGRQQEMHQSQRVSQQREFATQYEDMRDEAKDSHKQTQARYNKALQKERSRIDRTQDKLYGARGRSTRERDRLMGKIRDLKKKNAKDHARVQRQKKREIRNTKIAHQNTLDSMVNERRKMVNEYNRINSEEIGAANNRATKRMENNYEYFRGKMEENDDKFNRDLAVMRNKLVRRNNNKIEKNKLRNDAIQKDDARKRAQLKKMQDNQLQRLKDHHFNILDKERYDNSRNRRDLNEHYSGTVKDLDNDYHGKLAKVENKHTLEMDDLRDRHQKKIGNILQEQKRILVETQRSSQFLADNREKKYKYNLKKIRSF